MVLCLHFYTLIHFPRNMPESQYCLRKGSHTSRKRQFFIKMFSSKNQHGYIKERFSVTLYCIVCCYIFWQFLKKSPQMLFEERFSGNCCLEERGPHRPAANTNAPFNLLPKLLSFSTFSPSFCPFPSFAPSFFSSTYSPSYCLSSTFSQSFCLFSTFSPSFCLLSNFSPSFCPFSTLLFHLSQITISVGKLFCRITYIKHFSQHQCATQHTPST